MFERIEMMRMAQAMMGHAAQRNTVVARNIANADTPNFQAHDLQAFEETYRRNASSFVRTTREGHFSDPGFSPATAREIISGQHPSPNGNSVSLEEEMIKIAELKHQHDKSLSIYKSAIDLMRISIGLRA